MSDLHRNEDGELVWEISAAREKLCRPEVDVAGVSRESESMHVTVVVIDDVDTRRKFRQGGHAYFQQIYWL